MEKEGFMSCHLHMHFFKTTTSTVAGACVIILHLRSESGVLHHLDSRQHSLMRRKTTLTVGTQTSHYIYLLLNESS